MMVHNYLAFKLNAHFKRLLSIFAVQYRERERDTVQLHTTVNVDTGGMKKSVDMTTD